MDLKSKEALLLFFLLSLGCGKEKEIFIETYQYKWDGTPLKISSGRFNKDNLLDVIVSDYKRVDYDTHSYIHILLNRGNGMFESGPVTRGVFSTIRGLNGNNIDDIVTSGVSVFLIDDRGEFKNTYNIDFGFDWSIMVNYFNSDNIPDFVKRTLFRLITFIWMDDGTFNLILYEDRTNSKIYR